MSNTLEIRPAQRTSSKAVIGLAATSGGGKTFSALLLACGLAGGDPSKIGLLDTENRRGELYSDIFEKPFLIGNLTPPFSPDRYIRAMRSFSEKGIEVLVIDSITHEWEGEGGCEEIAQDALKRGKKTADWITAKREHKRFMNTLLFLPVHVIVCIRAREKSDFKNPREIVSLGVQPITEKNVMFEMTASFMLFDSGKRREAMKLPDNLVSVLDANGPITVEHGQNLRAWLGGRDEMEVAKSALRLAASEGMDSLGAAWGKLSKSQRVNLEEFKETLKDLAAHADSESAPSSDQRGDSNDW